MKGQPGGPLGGCLVFMVGSLCGLWLLTRPTRFLRWPVAFGAIGLTIGLIEGFIQGGSEGAMVLGFVATVGGGMAGLALGTIVCLVAKGLK
jgi:hypothetical protein